MATKTLYIDTNNQNEAFIFNTTRDSTPVLRAYVFSEGVAVSFTAASTAKFIYSYSRAAIDFAEIVGSVAIGDNYIDFEFTDGDLSATGKYFASVIVLDEGSIVQTDGVLTIKANPAV